jgi:hypothetical protein
MSQRLGCSGSDHGHPLLSSFRVHSNVNDSNLARIQRTCSNKLIGRYAFTRTIVADDSVKNLSVANYDNTTSDCHKMRPDMANDV